MFADKPKSLNDKLNDAAMGLSDNIVRRVLPENVRNAAKQHIEDNLRFLSNPLKTITDVPRLLREEKPDIFYDGCNFTWTTDYGVISYRNKYCQESPPPQPPEIPYPVSRDNGCAILRCNDGRVISTVRLNARYVMVDSDLLHDYADAQLVCNYEFQKTARLGNSYMSDYSPSWLKNKHLSIASLTNGFKPQLRSLPFFEIATTIGDETTISNDIFKDDGTGHFEGNIEYDVRALYYETDYPTGYAEDGVPYNGSYYHTKMQLGTWIVSRFKSPLCTIAPDPPPPPPPKPPMTCCLQNDQLLRLILKRIGSLPVDVPASYLTKNGVQPAQLKKVESLTEFIAWFAERFDETIGEFEITIDVDDADLTKQGKQTQTIRLPNLAESIAEMFSLMVHSNINNELILNIVNRTLIESGQIKQSEFKTFSALNALIDYVGFHTNSATEKMPLTFTPGELSFDRVLKETEIDVSVLTYTQKETLAATMQTLLQAAAIIRAVHYRRTPGTQKQIASTLKDDLKGLLGESGNLTDQVKTFITNIDKLYDGINKPS